MTWSENTSTERPRLVAKQVQKSIPSHLQTILDIRKNKLEASTSLQELRVVPAHQEGASAAPMAVLEPSRAIQKNVLSSDPERSLITADWDTENRLVLKFDDGSKITTPKVPIKQVVEPKIVVTPPPKVVDWLVFDNTAVVPEEYREPGMVIWNKLEDCLDVVQADKSTLQLGLEQYIEVYNDTSQPLSNMQVVKFVGVNNNELPKVEPLTANPDFQPLLIIGVMTNTVQPGQRGRATVFGKIRNIDTTGTSSSEVWQQGDMLWAHPTQAGKMTKVRPSAPNPVISIAVVLRVSSTEGLILVRPTIFPRLIYGKYLSTQTQTPALVNTPYAVTFNQSEVQSGVIIEDGSKLKPLQAGLYSFDFRLQVTSTNLSNKNIFIWARVNGVDVPNSTSKVTMLRNDVELAPSWNFVYSMKQNDYFQLMYACSDTAVSINASSSTVFCPSTPSAMIKVTQIDL